MRTLALLLALAASPSAAETRVDVALVLAVDVSLSMDPEEQRAQREGYLSAIGHPSVMDAIGRGLRGRIALSYVEWGGPYDQTVVVPWRVIASEEDAAAFAGELAFAPLRASRGTSIAAALEFSRRHLKTAPAADRLVVDVSGDGPNNQGEPVELARDRLLDEGVEINGLPLLLKEPDMLFSIPDLDRYYAACVIGGPGAFVIPVRAEAEFADAIRRKLVLEIAGPPPAAPGEEAAPAGPVPADFHVDCLVGEKLYDRWRRSMDWN